MRILVLTLMLSFLSQGVLGASTTGSGRASAKQASTKRKTTMPKTKMFLLPTDLCRKIDGFLDLSDMTREKLYLISPAHWDRLIHHHIQESINLRIDLKLKYETQLNVCDCLCANYRDRLMLERRLGESFFLTAAKKKMTLELAQDQEQISTETLALRLEDEKSTLQKIQDTYYDTFVELQSIYIRISCFNEQERLPHSYPYLVKLEEYLSSYFLKMNLADEVSIPKNKFDQADPFVASL